MNRSSLIVAGLLFGSFAVGMPASAQPWLPSPPFGSLDYRVEVNSPNGSPGSVFYSTGVAAAAVIPGSGQVLDQVPNLGQSNVIRAKDGTIVWQYDPPAGQGVANFRTQTLDGKTVLTWWQGTANGGHGDGVDYIADADYHVIKTLAPQGLTADVHEFRITPDGRALVTSYVPVTADLTSIGGPRDGLMLDCIASVIDVETGQTITQWIAAQHVPITDTEFPMRLPGSAAYDPFHMNSIALDPSGNLVISMRNTSAIYDVDLETGDVNWQLGGKRPTLRADDGVQFAFQHDAEFTSPGTLRLFNDNSSGPQTFGPSSVQWVHIDAAAGSAALVRNQTHPDGLVAFAMGNAQGLDNGDTFVGWGSAPRISEFGPNGELVYDASLPSGTYRAYLEPWPPAA